MLKWFVTFFVGDKAQFFLGGGRQLPSPPLRGLVLYAYS